MAMRKTLSAPAPTPAPAAPAQFHRIKSIAVVGGFLDGLRLDLADGLNCIIGARGTGKTTILELVRYTLDSLPDGTTDPAGRRRVESLVEKNLDGGRIELTVETKDGLTYIVSRAVGEEPLVLTEDRKPTDINLAAGGLFKADIYSQNEVESIADRTVSQLDLIDNFEAESIADAQARIQQAEANLAHNASAIIPLQDKVATLADELNQLGSVEAKLKTFAAAGGANAQVINQAHANKALRDRERRTLETTDQFFGEYLEQFDGLTNAIAGQATGLFTRDMLAGPNGAALTGTRQSIIDCGQEVDALLQQARDRIETERGKLAEAGSALSLVHAEQEMAFRAIIEKHQAAQGQAAERAKLERLRNDLLAKKRLREETAGKLAKLQQDRQALLGALSELRDERFRIREQVASRINAALSPEIRVTVVQYGWADRYQALLEEALRGAKLRAGPLVQKLLALWPSDLVTALRAKDTDTLIERAELSAEQAEKVVTALATAQTLFDLETVELSDRPQIELHVGGEYKNAAELSTGQKCTAILPILLLDSENPLLVDQPEDNLDNRFIYACVVERIREIKRRRQLVFVTHNPNIPVLGEADQVFVLEADGVAARVTNEGDVDQCKAEIVTLLEGGEEAFKERSKRYEYQ